MKMGHGTVRDMVRHGWLEPTSLVVVLLQLDPEGLAVVVPISLSLVHPEPQTHGTWAWSCAFQATEGALVETPVS